MWLAMSGFSTFVKCEESKTKVVQTEISLKNTIVYIHQNNNYYEQDSKNTARPRRFNYQMQLNWFRRAFDKKAAQELGSLVSFEVCY